MGIEIIGEPRPDGPKITKKELHDLLVKEDGIRDFNNKGIHPRIFIMGVPIDQLDKEDLIRLVRVIGNFK